LSVWRMRMRHETSL